MFRSFFTTIFRGSSIVLCAVTIPPADLHSLSLYYYAVCGPMCMSSVRVWCSCLLVICLWTEFTSISTIRTPNTHRWHTHATTYCVIIQTQRTHTSKSPTRTPNIHRWHTHAATFCVIIQTQRTQISGRNSNGTKHSRGPPEDDHEKRPKHVGVLYLQTRF
jgi:hypothetical protein